MVSLIRGITEGDEERLRAAARRFVQRHEQELQLLLGRLSAEDGLPHNLAWCLEHQADESLQESFLRARLRPLWRAAFRRAVREPHADGVAWGYIIRRAV